MPSSGKKKRLPNIVLIGIDSLRADHMSCYGYPHQTTPQHKNVPLLENAVRLEEVLSGRRARPMGGLPGGLDGRDQIGSIQSNALA